MEQPPPPGPGPHQAPPPPEGPGGGAGGLDHVVGPADEPEVAVPVPLREIARQVETAPEALLVPLRLAPVPAEHGGPPRPERQLALDIGLLDDLDAVVADLPDDRPGGPTPRAAHGAGPGGP